METLLKFLSNIKVCDKESSKFQFSFKNIPIKTTINQNFPKKKIVYIENTNKTVFMLYLKTHKKK